MKTFNTCMLLFILASAFCQEKLNVEGDGNIAGKLVLDSGNSNVFIGKFVGDSVTTGCCHTLIGNKAGSKLTSMNSVTAIGASSAEESTTTATSVFIGTAAGQKLLSGINNTYIGSLAGQNGTAGDANTYIGANAGQANEGGGNVYVGVGAASSATNSASSVIIGAAAGSGLTEGNRNTIVGGQAGQFLGIGENNTIIGFNAQASDTLFAAPPNFNATAIGANAVAIGSNIVRLGDYNVTTIEGAVDFTTPSDRRLKKNIKNSDLGLRFLEKLRPVTYELKKGHEGIVYTGFIAQEVEEAAQSEHHQFSAVQAPRGPGGFYGLTYSQFVVPLVKATQEQQALINQQQKEIGDLQEKLSAIEAEMAIFRNLTSQLMPKQLSEGGEAAND